MQVYCHVNDRKKLGGTVETPYEARMLCGAFFCCYLV